jgi:uncharacterized membrane protein
MSSWSFDILRQGTWDWWLWICIAAGLGLVSYAVVGKPWADPRRRLSLLLIGFGVIGTLLVLILPVLHSPRVGLIWTFVMLATLSATFYLNLTTQLGRRKMAFLLALRLIALALLVPMLFEPVIRYIARPKPERPLIFLIDASGSMSVPDQQNGPTRFQSVHQALRPQLPKIGEHFIPRFFTFSTAADELKSLAELANVKPDGQATDIVTGVTKVLQKVDRPDAQIVLISDGIDNTSPDVLASVRESLRPIHTVRVGSDQAEPATLANIAVEDIQAPDDFVVGTESKIRVVVKSTALPNRLVQVKMQLVEDRVPGSGVRDTGEDQNSSSRNPEPGTRNPISIPLVLQPSVEGQTVEFTFKPTRIGVQRLAVWVDPVVGERSTVDNRQEFQGLALDPRVKVLYIEGRARPEYKPLKFALDRDPNVELGTLLRTTQTEFDAAGTVGGEAVKKMPVTTEEWKNFDVIILGDLDSSFLTKAQQQAIEQAVNTGTGLLMIGGQNNFGPGGYAGSAIERTLPVFVGDLKAAQEKTQFVPRLTVEGSTHPAMEGLTEWFGVDDKPPVKSLPPLRGNVVVPKPKAGASVLITHFDRPGPDGQPQIVLAVQRYGDGRSAAFTVDTTYLWYLPLRGMGQDSPYNRLWGQLIRWLAGVDVKNRSRGAGVEALISKSIYQLGQTVNVRAMVRDDKGDATRFAQVSLSLEKVGTNEKQQFNLAPVDSHTGMYQIGMPSLQKGEYVAKLSATKDGKPLGSQELKFSIIAPADEMLKVAANPALLRSIATGTNGYAYELNQLPGLIDQLIRSDPNALQAKQQTIPLASFIRSGLTLVGHAPRWPTTYDLPMQAALAISLLSGSPAGGGS